MSDEPFGRQPQRVTITFDGDQRDVEHYLNQIKSLIESRSYDVTTRDGNTLTIHPRAVND